MSDKISDEISDQISDHISNQLSDKISDIFVTYFSCITKRTPLTVKMATFITIME